MKDVDNNFMKVINPLAWFITNLPRVGWKVVYLLAFITI